MADVQISVTEADVQIAVIDQENTQLALAAPDDNQVNIAVPGVQGAPGTVNAAADGTAAAPGISFASDTDVGLYRPAVNTLGITAGGVLRMSVGGNRIRVPEINQLQITDSTTDAAGLQFIGSSSANSTIGTISAQPLVFRTTSVERVRIDTSGRLGIGTSSPSQTLHVSGNALVAGANQATLTVGSGATTGPHSINVFGGGVGTNFGYQLDGNYRLYTNTNTGTNTNIASNSGNIIFLQSVGGSERARFDTSGRLGIGTSAPGNTLEVIGNLSNGLEGKGTINITSNTTTNNGFDASPSIGFSAPYSTGAPRILYGAVAAGKLNANSGNTAGYLSLYTSPASSTGVLERVRIDNTGRVGIGTTAPDALLTVNGIGAFGAGAVTTPSIAATGDLNTGFWFPAADTIAASTGGSERARIDSSGRLLVGTSTARTNFFNTSFSSLFQVEGANAGNNRSASVVYGEAGAGGPILILGKHRSNSIGGVTVVTADDQLGILSFQGSDGTEFVEAASVRAFVDGTPGANDMPGRLVFSTTADGAASPTEAFRVTSDKYLRMAASTGGIQFNGDTAAANALNDYEEGTWTPVVADAATAGNTATSYTQQYGYYCKIGNRVFVAWRLEGITTTGMTGANTLFIRALPFAIGNPSPSGQVFSGAASTANVAFDNSLGAFVNPGAATTAFRLNTSTSAGVARNLIVSNLTSGSANIFGQFFYFV